MHSSPYDEDWSSSCNSSADSPSPRERGPPRPRGSRGSRRSRSRSPFRRSNARCHESGIGTALHAKYTLMRDVVSGLGQHDVSHVFGTAEKTITNAGTFFPILAIDAASFAIGKAAAAIDFSELHPQRSRGRSRRLAHPRPHASTVVQPPSHLTFQTVSASTEGRVVSTVSFVLASDDDDGS